MKISLALGPRRPLDRQTAWGCLTSNFAAPGLGSLIAGRAVGYWQLAVTAIAMLLTVVFGGRFIYWVLINWTRLQQLQEDPVAFGREVWMMARWALLGIALFAAALLWGLVTSVSILREAKAPPPLVTPRS